MAGALAADGHRVMVVDMDPQAHAPLALGLEPADPDANLYEVLAAARPCWSFLDLELTLKPGQHMLQAVAAADRATTAAIEALTTLVDVPGYLAGSLLAPGQIVRGCHLTHEPFFVELHVIRTG